MTRSATETRHPALAAPRPGPDPIRTLLVEDDPDAARLATRQLESSSEADFRVCHEPSLAEALARLEEQAFDVMVLDVALPDVDGLVTVAHASLICRHVPIVILTGNPDATLFLQALRAGCQEYLLKEVQDRESLVRAAANAVARSPRRRGTSSD